MFNDINFSVQSFDALIIKETDRLRSFNETLKPPKKYKDYFCQHLLRLFKGYAVHYFTKKYKPTDIENQKEELPFTNCLQTLLDSIYLFDVSFNSQYKREIFRFFDEFRADYKIFLHNFDRIMRTLETVPTESRIRSSKEGLLIKKHYPDGSSTKTPSKDKN